MVITEQTVIEICNKNVDITKLTAKNYTLCIDGTSCTKKSSIIRHTGRTFSKNQYLNPNRNSNTFAPAMIGYICSGIHNLPAGGPHFEDRSPMNVLDWHILWIIMNDFLKTFGNVSVDETNLSIYNAVQKYKEIFSAYKKWHVYKMFINDINTIALIDSDVHRCDNTRYLRGEGSDKERSQWKFYTYLQNLMYKELYPKLVIDLAWFDDCDLSEVISGISKFLNSTLDILSQRPNLDYAPLINRRLPTPKCDYNLINITTHAYRSVGRWGCQILAGNEEPLKSRLPSYINVDNIMHPRGNLEAPIVSATVDYLFDNHTINNNNNINNNDEAYIEDCDMNDMF